MEQGFRSDPDRREGRDARVLYIFFGLMHC
jgi:hypothetical protein